MITDENDRHQWISSESKSRHKPSRLISVAPVGIGTPAAECLSCYVTRISDIHDSAVVDTVRAVISPELSHSYLDPGNVTFSSFKASASMNGWCKTATEWTTILEKLTHRKDLAYLTFLPFKEIVAKKKLLRIQRAWCPLCLDEWRRTEQVIYEPLLWKTESVKACPVHRCALLSAVS